MRSTTTTKMIFSFAAKNMKKCMWGNHHFLNSIV
jgi:hypothetical protein